MKTLLIILVVLAVVVVALLLLVLGRGVRRGTQRYIGLERQRDSAKSSRVAGSERLKKAERSLVEAQRVIGVGGRGPDLRAIERQRLRIASLADQLRYASYGYSAIGAAEPVREPELAELQLQDADLNANAQSVAELADDFRRAVVAGELPTLDPLVSALDLFQEDLERRRPVN